MNIGWSKSAGPHLDDDQLSLVVEGRPGPDDLAHADRCPDCAARAAHSRQVRGLIANPPEAVAGDRREVAISAALAVFDAETKEPEPAPVVDLARVRRGPVWRSRPAAAAAAVLLLVAGLGIGLGVGVAGSSHEHTAVSASGSTSPPTATAPGGAGSESQAPSAAAPGSAGPVAALGSFQDMAALAPALRSHLAPLSAGASSTFSGSASSPSTGPDVLRCQPAAVAAAGVVGATVPELGATLTFAGTPAVAYVYPAPAGPVAVVLSDGSCRVLGKGSL